jgi:hypothetical protein
MSHVHTSGRRAGSTARAVAVATVLGVAAALAASAPAQAQEPPFDRGIDDACPPGTPAYPWFPDVASDGTHSDAISCVAWRDIAVGQAVTDAPGDRRYGPGDDVTRGQMASFVARTVGQVPDELHTFPDRDPDAPDAFPDVPYAHLEPVNQLSDAGIVEGFVDGTFGSPASVTRAQVASFAARTIETVTDDELPRAGVFDDVTGPHRGAVEKLAAVGIVQGRSEGVYDPTSSVTRAEMATILARTLDHLVAWGFVPEPVAPLAGVPDTATKAEDGDPDAELALTDVTVAGHLGFDRVTIELDGAGDAGYHVTYTDEPVSAGSGEPIEIAGGAALEISVAGVLLPADLPPEIDPWDSDTIVRETAGSVLQVEDDVILHGVHTLFAGIHVERPMLVQRFDDPQRIVLDVFHGPQG